MKVVSGFVCEVEDWKRADVDDWNFDSIELEGNETLLGHKKIDNVICKIVMLGSKRIAAILEK